MAKKSDEKDVLIVRDEKTGEISVVAGLNADGSPKRTPARLDNAKDFLLFDKHGDMLDNFFKNFFRQCKEPSRFGFYRIAADQVDSKEKKEEQGETQKQENMEQKQEKTQEKPQTRQGYQPIDESSINWQELKEKWGIDREELEKSGDLQKMLNYGKSDLVKVSPKFGEETFELDLWTRKPERLSPRTSALTARRTKSPMSLPARYAYRKESERRKSPNRSRKCSVRGCR